MDWRVVPDGSAVFAREPGPADGWSLVGFVVGPGTTAADRVVVDLGGGARPVEDVVARGDADVRVAPELAVDPDAVRRGFPGGLPAAWKASLGAAPNMHCPCHRSFDRCTSPDC